MLPRPHREVVVEVLGRGPVASSPGTATSSIRPHTIAVAPHSRSSSSCQAQRRARSDSGTWRQRSRSSSWADGHVQDRVDLPRVRAQLVRGHPPGGDRHDPEPRRRDVERRGRSRSPRRCRVEPDLLLRLAQRRLLEGLALVDPAAGERHLARVAAQVAPATGQHELRARRRCPRAGRARPRSRASGGRLGWPRRRPGRAPRGSVARRRRRRGGDRSAPRHHSFSRRGRARATLGQLEDQPVEDVGRRHDDGARAGPRDAPVEDEEPGGDDVLPPGHRPPARSARSATGMASRRSAHADRSSAGTSCPCTAGRRRSSRPPACSAASVVTVPATPTTVRTDASRAPARPSASTAVSSAWSTMARASSTWSAVGGSSCRCRSVTRTDPSCIEGAATTPVASPTTSSVEPPPTSQTSVGGATSSATGPRGRTGGPPPRRGATSAAHAGQLDGPRSK